MSNVKKLMMTAAGGGGLNIEEVFSTYLYTGLGGQDNGIDLHNEGGLVWIKSRGSANHALFDTERGIRNVLVSNTSGQQYYDTNTLTAFSHDGAGGTGFFASADAMTGASGVDYVSWTFRKAPKFFDVVTYTGDNVYNRAISHNLGSTPGVIITKSITTAGINWIVYHKDLSTNGYLFLDLTNAEATAGLYSSTPTDTNFYISNNNNVNKTGTTYVSYLFAHNDGDGEFGPTGDQDIIKCGSYTATNGTALDVDLGFEPQWVMVKRYDSTGYWWIQDSMRGWGAENSGDSQKYLQANDTAAEKTKSTDGLVLTSTGFTVPATSGDFNSNGDYIYMAIRRGPMAVPESATDVFDVSDGSAGASGNAGRYRSGFTVDMGLEREPSSSDNWEAVTRMLQGTSLRPNDTSAEDTGIGNAQFDYMDGWNSGTAFADSYSWMWKRAPNFFDVVAYDGTSTAGHTVSHNLGVAPEMMWIKRRDVALNWCVYHHGIDVDGDGSPETDVIFLNANSQASDNNTMWNDTAPTATHFTLGNYTGVNNGSGSYIAYLFASLNGISKVGSYTGNGGTSVTGTGQNIDCGFSNGARFVLIKPTNAADHWFVYDSERGIVAGNDATLQLNLASAQSTSSDEIDPLNSGFTILNGNNQLNRTGREYIFYAIA